MRIAMNSSHCFHMHIDAGFVAFFYKIRPTVLQYVIYTHNVWESVCTSQKALFDGLSNREPRIQRNI